jgi:hypothetical protein
VKSELEEKILLLKLDSCNLLSITHSHDIS